MPAESSEAGFTLIEVLCAISIAALGLVMVMQMFAASERAGRRLADDFSARQMLRSLMARRVVGTGEQGALSWSVTSQPSAEAAVTLGTKYELRRRDVTIRDASGQLMALSFYVLDPRAP